MSHSRTVPGDSPVIQLYSESENSFTYRNLYYTEGKVVTDELTYSGKLFRMNGSTITEDTWNKNVNTYNKIILSTYLSGSSDLSDIRYNYTLKQTEQVVNALSQSHPSEFETAEGKYISLYLQEIDHINQDCLNLLDYGNFQSPFDYGVYDIDHNGTPELIVETNMYCFSIYTIVNGELKKFGEEFDAKDAGIYINGTEGVIKYFGRMGNYEITKITLDNATLKIVKIADGDITGEEEYPDLGKFGLGDYNKYLDLCYGTTPLLLYTYNIKE